MVPTLPVAAARKPLASGAARKPAIPSGWRPTACRIVTAADGFADREADVLSHGLSDGPADGVSHSVSDGPANSRPFLRI